MNAPANTTAPKLAYVLDANPGATTNQLAALAGIGKSTAGKILAAWEKDGDAVRTLRDKGAATWSRPAPAQPEPVQDAPKEKVTVNKTGQDRLTRGGLRADVLGWLYDNPGTEITPSKMGKALGGRSAGACHNALVVLTREGITRMTSEAPKTFALAAH